MSDATGFLDADRLRADTFVRHVELHDTLPSTNDCALALALDASLQTPALVVARRQTAGRGRGPHDWWATDGALTFSLLIDSDEFGITQRDWPRLSVATAVAVCDALERCEVPPSHLGIKWPNDVLVDGRKVCGILIESPGGTAPAGGRLVVGVGINVNNSWRDAPQDAGPCGTSLCDESGREHDPAAVLQRVLSAVERRLRQLAANDPELPPAWQRRCRLTGQTVEIDAGDRCVRGVCQGIADDGALVVKRPSAIERVYSGTVKSTM